MSQAPPPARVFAVERRSTWRGTYERLMHVADGAVRTFAPGARAELTNVWPREALLGVEVRNGLEFQVLLAPRCGVGWGRRLSFACASHSDLEGVMAAFRQIGSMVVTHKACRREEATSALKEVLGASGSGVSPASEGIPSERAHIPASGPQEVELASRVAPDAKPLHLSACGSEATTVPNPAFAPMAHAYGAPGPHSQNASLDSELRTRFEALLSRNAELEDQCLKLAVQLAHRHQADDAHIGTGVMLAVAASALRREGDSGSQQTVLDDAWSARHARLCANASWSGQGSPDAAQIKTPLSHRLRERHEIPSPAAYLSPHSPPPGWCNGGSAPLQPGWDEMTNPGLAEVAASTLAASNGSVSLNLEHKFEDVRERAPRKTPGRTRSGRQRLLNGMAPRTLACMFEQAAASEPPMDGRAACDAHITPAGISSLGLREGLDEHRPPAKETGISPLPSSALPGLPQTLMPATPRTSFSHSLPPLSAPLTAEVLMQLAIALQEAQHVATSLDPSAYDSNQDEDFESYGDFCDNDEASIVEREVDLSSGVQHSDEDACMSGPVGCKEDDYAHRHPMPANMSAGVAGAKARSAQFGREACLTSGIDLHGRQWEYEPYQVPPLASSHLEDDTCVHKLKNESARNVQGDKDRVGKDCVKAASVSGQSDAPRSGAQTPPNRMGLAHTTRASTSMSPPYLYSTPGELSAQYPSPSYSFTPSGVSSTSSPSRLPEQAGHVSALEALYSLVDRIETTGLFLLQHALSSEPSHTVLEPDVEQNSPAKVLEKVDQEGMCAASPLSIPNAESWVQDR